MLRFLDAGESHGKALVAIIEGLPANLELSESDINKELKRRQQGYGRSERMVLEKDSAEIISGLRKGKTTGAPLTILIPNKDSADRIEPVTKLRPGHADLAGALKYNQQDIRGILERASARETSSRVAVGAVAKKFLEEFRIKIESKVLEIVGDRNPANWEKLIDKAKDDGDSLGGIFEISVFNVPVGLGSHAHFDRKLDGRLAMAVMSIQAIKGVEIGLGFASAKVPGSKAQDEIIYKNDKFGRKTNNAGGIEGGISNGEPVIIRAAMKPIPTIRKPFRSVDLVTKEEVEAHFERADVCAVEAAAVVVEAAAAFVIAGAFLEKFGGDSMEEIKARYK